MKVGNLMKYIALLRGVNISGKNKIPMKKLKEALEKDYNNVFTYLNTGTVSYTHLTLPTTVPV